jgi:PIN domain nuclease of toxin-antitoxin system
VSNVIDSSALLALVLSEPGAAFVEATLDDGAFLSSVSLAEVVAKLSESQDERQVRRSLLTLRFETVPFLEEHAWRAAALRNATRAIGLSLGDRACLALAQSLGLPALTADRRWAEANVGVKVVLCR